MPHNRSMTAWVQIFTIINRLLTGRDLQRDDYSASVIDHCATVLIRRRGGGVPRGDLLPVILPKNVDRGYSCVHYEVLD